MITGDKEGEAVKARVMLATAAEELRALALSVSTVIKKGDPQTVLIGDAREWVADCMIVGALGFDTALRRSGLGRVGMGLVTNAPCTVGIVR